MIATSNIIGHFLQELRQMPNGFVICPVFSCVSYYSISLSQVSGSNRRGNNNLTFSGWKGKRRISLGAIEAMADKPETFLRDSGGVPSGTSSVRARFEKMIRKAQDDVCTAVEEVDGHKFKEDAWSRPGGGGGISRMLQDGNVWEKAGVNVSVVYGEMPPDAYRAARAADSPDSSKNLGAIPFFAAGISSGLFLLYHILASNRTMSTFNSWLSVVQLGLMGSLAIEWNIYIQDLYYVNIQIGLEDDMLLWSWNIVDGSVNAKMAYQALCYHSSSPAKWWHVPVWKWNIPSRVQIFIWLLLEEKVLIWSNLQKRGFCGPSICSLCHQVEETLFHLFVMCPFILTVCKILGYPFAAINFEHDRSIQSWFRCLFTQNKQLGLLACILSWTIWKSRNLVIFEDRPSVASRVAGVVQSLSNDFGCSMCVSPPTAVRNQASSCLLRSSNRACFDGAASPTSGHCGVGAFIELYNGDQIKLWLHGGDSTNTKGELLALWLVLFFSSKANFTLEQVAGDSMIIVNWANFDATINALALTHWMDKTMYLFSIFPSSSIIHIYRELNTVADSLSRRGLVAAARRIYYEIREGSMPPTYGFWNLFVV